MTPGAAQLSALSRLFSSAVLQEFAKKGRSAMFIRLLDQTDVGKRSSPQATVADAFDSAFDILKFAGHRDEYIYRSAIAQKVLLGKHSLRTASMLSEFRIGACKADLVILNGTASVYEIKSDRDTLARVANQVETYMRVFGNVNVIASDRHMRGVTAAVPEEVGILSLSSRFQISVEREAVDCPERICPVTVLESLRTSEAAAILKALGLVVPDVPNTQCRAAMRELFADIDPAKLHYQFVQILKRTRNLAPLSDLVDQLPRSLHAAALSVPLRRNDHFRLVNAISTPLSVALTWA